MTPESFLHGRVVLHPGDCLTVLDTLPENSIDSCVCDPPYHLSSIVKRFGADDAAPAKIGATGAFARASRGFMGKQWDGGDIAFRPETWAKVLRVLKPGGYLVAFSGTRTYHRMACAIEDAGFDIRDSLYEFIASDSAAAQFMASLNEAQAVALARCVDESGFGGILQWLYGSGFPKSHNISKSIDKMLGAERPVVGTEYMPNDIRNSGLLDAKHGDRPGYERNITEAATDAAREYEHAGTALKPAVEPIALARKPLIGTVAENVTTHGTGGLNIGECRIAGDDKTSAPVGQFGGSTIGPSGHSGVRDGSADKLGRWPANILHDGSAEVVEGFPETTSTIGIKGGTSPNPMSWGDGRADAHKVSGHADSGSAARFFYTAKADVDDRLGSKHPTVKPVDLMQWLVRLVTPKGGTVLDLFAGTGTTGEAAFREGRRAVLIEREPEYQNDIRRRMKLVLGGPDERRYAAINAGGKTADAGPLVGGTDDVGGGRSADLRSLRRREKATAEPSGQSD